MVIDETGVQNVSQLEQNFVTIVERETKLIEGDSATTLFGQMIKSEEERLAIEASYGLIANIINRSSDRLHSICIELTRNNSIDVIYESQSVFWQKNFDAINFEVYY